MKLDKKSLILYAITDRKNIGSASLLEKTEAAILGGATLIQLREKNMEEDMFLKEAIKMKKLCEKYNIPLIINDNVFVALKANADGVHLGQSDLSIKKAREILGDKMIIGATAKTIEQAKKAQNEGADYLGSGAVFGSDTKKDAIPMSFETLKEITMGVSIPVVAIGGICEENVLKLKGSGISGIALSNTIFSSDDTKKTCQRLFNLSKQVINTKGR